ncbi:hypothetical protein RRG08_019521 [Elysia crispata]|uniref:Uncharacterized protein n=1 Tax=Elysia crispata TaxID=231223 RepID=A0AAE1D6J6_9GAST|nr:hypothetical protein RRG08_019521 [Elysia crispata]
MLITQSIGSRVNTSLAVCDTDTTPDRRMAYIVVCGYSSFAQTKIIYGNYARSLTWLKDLLGCSKGVRCWEACFDK